MKTGFTCPAGFNVVASAAQGGRRLIVVVLGAPSARERTVEAAHLFDRGFAQWGGGEGPVADLPASATLSPPDMRPEICSRRNRAAIAAAEEEDEAVIAPTARATGRAPAPPTLGQGAPTPEPMTAETASEPVHFDPVPVFIGPKPGWTGPVLAARPPAGAPARRPATAATAYFGEKTSIVEGVGARGAPAALQGALRPVKRDKKAAAPPSVHEKRVKSAAVDKPAHGKPAAQPGKKKDASGPPKVP
jgi:D-alanyl-D-alanine carboxypeptidase